MQPDTLTDTTMTAMALRRVRHVVLDMDGTIYLGGTALPCTAPFLESLRRRNIGYSFLTNNNSLGRRQYAQKLAAMGIDAQPRDLVLSTDATIAYLRRTRPGARDLYVLGTPGLVEDLNAAGYRAVEDAPQAVVVGFDTTLTYERLCRAAYWISRDVPFISTHPDRLCPTDQPTMLPDCGSLCALLEHATGRSPEAVCGKPSPFMIQTVLERLALDPRQVAMVGDRLYTDMEMARRASVLGVLVLSGETTASQAASAQPPPDLVVRDLGELEPMLA